MSRDLRHVQYGLGNTGLQKKLASYGIFAVSSNGKVDCR